MFGLCPTATFAQDEPGITDTEPSTPTNAGEDASPSENGDELAPSAPPSTPAPPAAERVPQPPPATIPPPPPPLETSIPRWSESIVRVLSPNAVGTGFVAIDAQHVVTALHLVEEGHGVDVRTQDGVVVAGDVIAVDEDSDLALIRLERALTDVSPLPFEDSVRLGEEVYVIGHPAAGGGELLEGLFSWSISRGIISGVGPRAVQTDAAVNQGTSGAPILNGDGRVVGVVILKFGEGLGVGVRSNVVQSLIEDREQQDGYSGRWRFGVGLGFQIHADPDGAWFGGYIGGTILGFDRFALQTRIGFLINNDSADSEEVFEISRSRWSIELEAQYRFLIPVRPGFPIYLQVGLGGVVHRDSVEESRLSLRFEDGCDPSTDACGTSTFVSRSTDRDAVVRPQASIGVRLGQALELSYAFQPDFGDLGDSSHRILLGFGI
ncbi:MAG: serine protease [Myxococcota bacterium]